MISKDDFEQWRDSLVTEKVREYFAQGVVAAEEEWVSLLTDTKFVPAEELVQTRMRLQERTRVNLEFVHLDYEDLEEEADEESERDTPR